MTKGQVLLALAFLASAGLSVALLVVVARQGRALESVRQSLGRLADRATTPDARPEAATLESLPLPAAPPPPSQPSIITAVLGVPLLKLAALGFGLRQALDADHRRQLSRVVDAELRAARRRRRTASRGLRRPSVGPR